MKQQTVFIVSKLLKQFSYQIDKKKIALRILSDPNNLVLSITNTLDYFNLKHLAAIVPKEALEQLPKYFIAQINNGKTERIVLVIKEIGSNIKIQVDKNKELSVTEKQFLKDWTGFIIAIEKNKSARKVSLFKETATLISLMVFAIFSMVYVVMTTYNIWLMFYYTLSLTGLGISYLILKEKLGEHTFASKYCKVNNTRSCNTVLNSKEAKLFKSADLSDAVTIYFMFVSSAFLVQPNSIIFVVLAATSLPVILYSLYQQYFKIQKWCTLCLGVATILILQFIMLLPVYEIMVFSVSNIIVFISVLGTITVGWLRIKPLISLGHKNERLEIENLSFRRNHHLFLPYYSTLETVDTKDETIPQITLGTVTPLLKLLVITNPMCKSCIATHKTYMDILENYRNEVQLNVRFLVPHKDRTNPKTIISERLLQLFFENETTVFLKAFNDWYDNVDTNKWVKKWNTCEDLKYNKIVQHQVRWCLEQGIDSTPAMFINTKVFSQNYSIEDIANFIDPILEQEKAKSKKEINNIHA